MKLDYDLLRNILEHVEETTDGDERHTISRSTFSQSPIQCESFKELSYHFDMLFLNSFMEDGVIRTTSGGHRVANHIHILQSYV